MAVEPAPIHRATAIICNERGLHARASAKFVTLAAKFDADIQVTREDVTVAGISIMGLLTLGAGPGAEIELTARGPEAAMALAALLELISGGFGEEAP
jgi:phosphocarrier protein